MPALRLLGSSTLSHPDGKGRKEAHRGAAQRGDGGPSSALDRRLALDGRVRGAVCPRRARTPISPISVAAASIDHGLRGSVLARNGIAAHDLTETVDDFLRHMANHRRAAPNTV